MDDMKAKFIDIYKRSVIRDGADKLLAWLETTDFFTAPASTRFHGNYPGGLCEHSLHVFERLRGLCKQNNIEATDETIAVCGLLHDLCKADFYKQTTRNRKNEQTGQWEKVPYYEVNDLLPYGHGEKSVYIISGFMRLSREEAMAIRWHMGGFDEAVRGGSYSLTRAYEMYPLSVLLHMADLAATYIDESREEK